MKEDFICTVRCHPNSESLSWIPWSCSLLKANHCYAMFESRFSCGADHLNDAILAVANDAYRTSAREDPKMTFSVNV